MWLIEMRFLLLTGSCLGLIGRFFVFAEAQCLLGEFHGIELAISTVIKRREQLLALLATHGQS